MENPEPISSPNIGSAQTSPAPAFTSPSTPEQRPGTVHCTLHLLHTDLHSGDIYIYGKECGEAMTLLWAYRPLSVIFIVVYMVIHLFEL
jgi:hypothetical protein